MRHHLWPPENLALLIEAFLGTKKARDEYSRTVRSPITIESGLAALRARWPELRSLNQSAPVFIFSAGWRSGSTFLQRWVMTNDCILVWGEPYSRNGVIQSLASQLRAFTQSWPSDEFFTDRHAHTGNLSHEWIANLYPSIANLMEAHIGYLEKLFLGSALASGKSRWGLKEVKLGIDHALYLRWLFPNAKFLFLYRDPYDAYASYRKWRNWYRAWPGDPVFTAGRFGALWRELASDFMKNHHKVGGLLLKYEELQTRATRSELEGYLGFSVEDASSLARVGSARISERTRSRSRWIPRLEKLLLKRQVEPVSLELGYRRP